MHSVLLQITSMPSALKQCSWCVALPLSFFSLVVFVDQSEWVLVCEWTCMQTSRPWKCCRCCCSRRCRRESARLGDARLFRLLCCSFCCWEVTNWCSFLSKWTLSSLFFSFQQIVIIAGCVVVRLTDQFNLLPNPSLASALKSFQRCCWCWEGDIFCFLCLWYLVFCFWRLAVCVMVSTADTVENLCLHLLTVLHCLLSTTELAKASSCFCQFSGNLDDDDGSGKMCLCESEDQRHQIVRHSFCLPICLFVASSTLCLCVWDELSWLVSLCFYFLFIFLLGLSTLTFCFSFCLSSSFSFHSVFQAATVQTWAKLDLTPDTLMHFACSFCARLSFSSFLLLLFSALAVVSFFT